MSFYLRYSPLEQRTAQFELVLVMADARRNLGDLPLLIQAEAQEIVVDWNSTTAYPPRALIASRRSGLNQFCASCAIIVIA